MRINEILKAIASLFTLTNSTRLEQNKILCDMQGTITMLVEKNKELYALVVELRQENQELKSEVLELKSMLEN